MSIKYGELTIIKENEPKSLFYWLTHEYIEKYIYIFLFEDGEISDTIVDFHFKFLDSIASVLPLYFEKPNTIRQIYFDKNIKDTLSFNPLFMNNPKYKSDRIIESKYNCIYDCYKSSKPEIFGLIRIKSTEQMPRFQFAYDSDEFTKEEISYVIHRILSKTYK
jgi:hypothetical protein